MKSLSTLFFLFAACTACASPEYVDANRTVAANSECSLKFNSLNLCGQMEWSQTPKNQTYTTFTLTLNDASLTAADLKVYLWMPSMGHGSAPVQIVDLGNGVFDIQQVYFVMPGSWEIRFEITKNGITDSYFHTLMIAR